MNESPVDPKTPDSSYDWIWLGFAPVFILGFGILVGYQHCGNTETARTGLHENAADSNNESLETRSMLAPIPPVPIEDPCPLASTKCVPSEFSTIQAAVDAAANGDTILISGGNYQGIINIGTASARKENLTVAREATGPIVSLQGRIVIANASGIVIDGLDIHDSDLTGILAGDPRYPGANHVIRNCTIRKHPQRGIQLGYANGSIIENNKFLQNGLYGIYVDHSNNLIIRKNYVSNGNLAGYGIANTTNSSTPAAIRIDGNTIVDNGIGILLGDWGGDTIVGNKFINNTIGISAYMHSDRLRLSDNVFDVTVGTESGPSGQIALNWLGADNAVIQRTTIRRHGFPTGKAIFLGEHFGDVADHNLFVDTVFENNSVNVDDQGVANQFTTTGGLDPNASLPSE